MDDGNVDVDEDEEVVLENDGKFEKEIEKIKDK